MACFGRLVEFEDTASGNLTIDQFQTIDLEEEADPPSFTQSRKEAKMKQVLSNMSVLIPFTYFFLLHVIVWTYV